MKRMVRSRVSRCEGTGRASSDPTQPLFGNRSFNRISGPDTYDLSGNLRNGETETLRADLTSDALPKPRLQSASDGVVDVPACRDFRLDDISDESDPWVESLNVNGGTWSAKFNDVNRKFLTKWLWGTDNERLLFHYGRFTMLRQSVLTDGGEALDSRRAFQILNRSGQDEVIEFLRILQVSPSGTKDFVVDETFRARPWAARSGQMIRLNRRENCGDPIK